MAQMDHKWRNIPSKGTLFIWLFNILWYILRYLCNIFIYSRSRFTTGLRSRIFGCKSNRRKTSTIWMVYIVIGSWDKQISHIILQFIFLYITLHFFTLHYISLPYVSLHYISLHYISFLYITLHFISLHYITLPYITFHCISLYYITFLYIT